MVQKKGKRAILTKPFFLDLLALQIYQHFSRNPFVKHGLPGTFDAGGFG
jgi:hypothetical protein